MAWKSLLFSGLNSLLAVTASSDSLSGATSKLLHSLQHLCGEKRPPVCRWAATPTVNDRKKNFAPLQWFFSRSSAAHREASAGGRELIVVRHAAYCRPGNSHADKRVRRGRMPGSTFLSSQVGVMVGWWSVVCLLRSSAVLQNHEVVSGWHVR
jgi:hypothetical protein